MVDEEFIELAKKFQDGGEYDYVVDAMAIVEESYSCSGACESNLFYFTQDVAAGKPTNSCVTPLMDDFAGILGTVGLTAIISGLALLCSWFWSYCLWRKGDD